MMPYVVVLMHVRYLISLSKDYGYVVIISGKEQTLKLIVVSTTEVRVLEGKKLLTMNPDFYLLNTGK
jgi:hypothetical protein